MSVPIIRILLCLVLSLMLLSSLGCPSDACIKYQDIALVDLPFVADIDSVAMIVNDSIVGCGRTVKAVGSKTHRVKFPINVRLQFFSQGDLRKELSFEMDKNTVAAVYTGINCSKDSSVTDDYCWSSRKMGSSFDYERCTEYSLDGKRELCDLDLFL